MSDEQAYSTTRRDRRVHVRAAIRVRIRLSSITGVTLSGWARNISIGGLYIESDKKLPVGADCHIEIPIVDGETLHTLKPDACIRWTDDNGMGIQFTHISAADREIARKLVEGEIPGAEPDPPPAD
ncbi:MAG: PilZ domain-containing protein [Leptospirillia bacterium]